MTRESPDERPGEASRRGFARGAAQPGFFKIAWVT
jgi:hypothetical protein